MSRCDRRSNSVVGRSVEGRESRREESEERGGGRLCVFFDASLFLSPLSQLADCSANAGTGSPRRSSFTGGTADRPGRPSERVRGSLSRSSSLSLPLSSFPLTRAPPEKARNTVKSTSTPTTPRPHPSAPLEPPQPSSSLRCDGSIHRVKTALVWTGDRSSTSSISRACGRGCYSPKRVGRRTQSRRIGRRSRTTS
jgi:hypothetical protein